MRCTTPLRCMAKERALSHDYSQAHLRILRLVQPIRSVHLLDLLAQSVQHLLDKLCMWQQCAKSATVVSEQKAKEER